MAPMNSQDEDALFEQWGWRKDLIARQYESPLGVIISFDEVVASTSTRAGEEMLRFMVATYGRAREAGLDAGASEA